VCIKWSSRSLVSLICMVPFHPHFLDYEPLREFARCVLDMTGFKYFVFIVYNAGVDSWSCASRSDGPI